MPQARLSGINQYKNLTIGVSLVNNAELESDIVDFVIRGSTYPTTTSTASLLYAGPMLLLLLPLHTATPYCPSAGWLMSSSLRATG